MTNCWKALLLLKAWVTQKSLKGEGAKHCHIRLPCLARKTSAELAERYQLSVDKTFFEFAEPVHPLCLLSETSPPQRGRRVHMARLR